MANEDILELTKGLVLDEDLSEEDKDIILDAVRKRNEETPLTQAELNGILDVVREYTTHSEYSKLPKIMKALSIFLMVAGGLQILSLIALALATAGSGVVVGYMAKLTVTSVVVASIMAVSTVASIVLSFIIGIRLRRGKRGAASVMITASLALVAVATVCEFMLFGLRPVLIDNFIQIAVMLVIQYKLNPSIARTSELKAGLRSIDTEARAKRGTLGLADPGKGFIRLDFFNVFWTFVVCCVLGLIVEIIWHVTVVEPGVYQDRAGLLFGPFSPIYGVGAVLMTVCLNRFKDKNVIIIFLICTVIGGGFEYFTSWFMEIAFGAVAWDYSHMPSGPLFGGRTCVAFASMFGLLGLVWIKLLLPGLLRIINLIPWKLRHGVTLVCALLMAVNICMTLQSLDNWSEHINGKQPVTPVEQFYAENFGNDVMQNRFQSMTLTPGASSRSS